MLIFIILPVIVRLKITQVTGDLLLYFPAKSGVSFDLTAYFKSLFFVIVTAGLLLYFLGERIFPDEKVKSPLIGNRNNRVFILLSSLFCFFVLISLIFSSKKQIALSGAPNSFEGSLVLLCYMVIFLLSVNYFDDDFNVKAIMNCLPFLFLFFILYGTVEYFYKNPYEINFLQYFVIPSDLWGMIGKFSFSRYRGQIFLTFANPDYAGEYLTLFLPISMILVNHSKGLRKAFGVFLSSGLILLLLLAGSLASIFAFLASLVVLGVIYHRILIKSLKTVLCVALAAAALTAVFGILKYRAAVPPFLESSTLKTGKPVFKVDNIHIVKNEVFFDSGKNSLVLKAEDGGLSFYDGKGKRLDALFSDYKYTFRDKFCKAVDVTAKGNNYSVDLGYAKPVLFTFLQGRVYALGTNNIPITNISDNSGFGFKNMQSFATGRGYIWRKTLPLLLQTLFAGFGADCGVFHIPQNDFAGKLNYQGSAYLVIDKPHDAFLQTWVDCGLPALIALILIISLYLIKTVKLLYNGKPSKNYDFSAAVLAGVIGYLICSVFYDSNISTAPLFWALLGMGVALGEKANCIQPDCNLGTGFTK